MTSMLTAALTLAGCDKKDSSAQSGSQKNDGDSTAAKAAEVKADAHPQDDGPFAAFDLPGVTKKWQGAWLLDGGRKAWEVSADKVTVFDGNTDKTLEFDVQAPCQVAVTERSDGGSSSTIHKFAFDADTLYAGLGNSGVKKGDAVVACISNKVYTLQDGKCLAWKESMFDKGKWESSDATCTLSGETFEVEGTTLEVVGDALVDTQMKGNRAERQDSLDAAKSALR
jgi:hypothetical protein